MKARNSNETNIIKDAKSAESEKMQKLNRIQGMQIVEEGKD